jgi:hypothetical protein
MNQDYEYLVEDPLIPTQRFSVVSFAEPKNEKLLERKEGYIAYEFITSYLQDRLKAMKILEENKKVPLTLQEYVEETPKLSTIKDLYKTFKETNYNKLVESFNKSDNQKTELIDTAFKIRGSFITMEEAQKRASDMKKTERSFDTYIVETGKWVPYMPLNKLDIGNIHYDHEQLNSLMSYNVNQDIKREMEFQKRKERMMNEIQKEEAEKKQLATIDEEKEEEKEELVDATVTTIGRDEVKTSDKSKRMRKWNKRRRTNRRRR